MQATFEFTGSEQRRKIPFRESTFPVGKSKQKTEWFFLSAVIELFREAALLRDS
jgi:hypothetical protein